MDRVRLYTDKEANSYDSAKGLYRIHNVKCFAFYPETQELEIQFKDLESVTLTHIRRVVFVG